MSYIVLSRKYRPKKLEDLIGQKVLFETLKNSIDNNKIPHAFIFYGIRGIGKTTVARIIARCLNCELGITSSPCGECKSCKAIDIDNHLDVMELDAASRTGVDDIRDIIDSSQYSPVSGRFKIFIIDEVHMLSKSAFNALLKTLEEPPPHVKFIFATTEINKVPDTILSRCMAFNLRPVSILDIKQHIIKISELENVKIDDEAAEIIATESEGSVRDALSLLEQAMMLAIKKPSITKETITEMIGGAKNSDIEELLNLILSAKTDESLTKSELLIKNGADPFMIFKSLQGFLYRLITKKVNDKNSVKYELSNLLYLWQILLKQSTLIKVAEYPEQVLNALIIILSHTASFPSIESLMIKDNSNNISPTTNNSVTIDISNFSTNNSKANIVNDILEKFPGSIVSEIE